jgi:hypothetical protein
LELFSLDLDLGSNGWGPGDYSLYGGRFLSEGDKQELLGSIPESGYRVVAGVEAGGGATIANGIGLRVGGRAGENVNIPRDVLDLLLMGNEVDRTYDLRDTGGEVAALAEASIFYSRRISLLGGETCIGGAVKLVKGLAYGGVAEAGGTLYSGADELSGDGRIVLRTSMGGMGYGADFGVCHRTGSDFTFSIYVQDVLSSITWTDRCEEEINTFLFENVVLGGEDPDSLITSESESRTLDSFRTRLSPKVMIGVNKTWAGTDIGATYRQGLGSGPFHHGKPEALVWGGRRITGWFEFQACIGYDGIAGIKEGVRLEFGGRTRLAVGAGFAPSPVPSSVRHASLNLALVRTL